MQVNEKTFVNRKKASDKNTNECIDILLNIKHFKDVRPVTLEEDKIGIDLWADFSKKKNVPIQFKIRYNWPDFPVVIAQPFYGWNHENTKKGRDIKALFNHMSEYYYVGVTKNNKLQSVSRCESKELCRICTRLIAKWNRTKDNWDKPEMFNELTTRKWIKNKRNEKVFSDGKCDIWWKKNWNEKYGKFNLYVPPKELVTHEILYEA